MACSTRYTPDVLYVICTRSSPGHLSVHVGDSSRRSKEIVKKKKKNLDLRLSMRSSSSSSSSSSLWLLSLSLLFFLQPMFCAATLRWKSTCSVVLSPIHSITMPAIHILALTVQRPASGRVATRIAILKCSI